MASVRMPQITSSTPIWAIFALLVNPIFTPTIRSPRASRREMPARCTRYAPGRSSSYVLVSLPIAVRRSAA